MKIDKKTIIILIIVAVAGYLLWKRMKEKGVSATIEDTVLTTSPDKTSLNYILTHVNFSMTERQKIEKLRQAAENSEMTYQQILAEANAKGYSYDQMLVLKAIWLLYHPNDAWVSGPDGTTTYGWKLQQKVINL